MVDVSKKIAYVDQIQQKLSKAKVCVVSGYEGVNVEQINALRREIRKLGDEMRVVRNTLVHRALKNLKKEGVIPHVKGPIALTFGYSSPSEPVKALFQFSEKEKKFSLKGGFLGDRSLSFDELKKLSTLPSHKQLLGLFLCALKGPLNGVVNVLQGPIRKFAYALEAIRQKKEKEPSPAPI
ncbi:50S ribosomal protein L10 [bacterium]|nr:50S ribosomal protein L10 [bacterium]